VATGQLVRSLQSYDNGDYADIAFSPNGKYLAAASTDGNLNVWDVATGTLLARLSGTSGNNLVGVSFSPSGDAVATSDNAGNTYVWNMTWLNQ
jgi:WD40 repeat protein